MLQSDIWVMILFTAVNFILLYFMRVERSKNNNKMVVSLCIIVLMSTALIALTGGVGQVFGNMLTLKKNHEIAAHTQISNFDITLYSQIMMPWMVLMLVAFFVGISTNVIAALMIEQKPNANP